MSKQQTLPFVTPSTAGDESELGPWKRRPTERVLQNGDPFVKRAKASHSDTTPTKLVAGRRQRVEMEEVEDEDAPPPSPPASRASKLSQHRAHPLTSQSSFSSAASSSSVRPSATHIPRATKRRVIIEEVEDEEAPSRSPSPYLPARGPILEAVVPMEKPARHVNVIESDVEEMGSEDEVEVVEETEEDDEAELARMSASWVAPIYVFFKQTPSIDYIEGRKAHVFHCGAKRCRGRTCDVRRYLDTGDVTSTSNLRRHAKKCWGEDAVDAADETQDVEAARNISNVWVGSGVLCSAL